MKSPFSHIILASCACVTVIIAYGFWYAAVGAKSVTVASLESRVATKTETANQIAASRSSLAEIARDEATIQSYFVPETGVVPFIDSLQALGKEQGTSVDVLSVSSAGAGTEEPSLLLSLTINGTFSAVMRTVGAIEYAPYNLTISALSIMQKPKEGWRADVNLIVGSVSATQTATNTP